MIIDISSTLLPYIHAPNLLQIYIYMYVYIYIYMQLLLF